MPLKTALLVGCALMGSTTLLRAAGSETPPVSPAGISATPLASAAAPVQVNPVDLSALWYFATQKNFRRVEAEITRIRTKYPDWSPPDDLFAATDGGGDDEQPLWDLFGKHDLEGVQARIDGMKRDNPDWTPSSNLATKLALALAHDALVRASDAKQWPEVIGIATRNKALRSCGDLDAVWRIAEAYAQTEDEARATDAYRYVLTTCDRPNDRLATLQKASLMLKAADDFDGLLRMGRRTPDGQGEFDQLRLDRFRRKIGEAAADRTVAVPMQTELDALAAVANRPDGQTDAQLLGWYNYAHKAYPAAKDWFKTALAAGADPKAAEGLVLTLRADHDMMAAREAAVRYRSLDENTRKLLVEILSVTLTDPTASPPTPSELAALTSVTDELKSQDGAQALLYDASNRKDKAGTDLWSRKAIQWKGEELEGLKSAEGAEALGWQLYAANDVTGAESWFRKSAQWAPSESAAVGLVLTAHRLGHAKDVATWVVQYGTQFPRVAELGKSMRPGVKRAPSARTASSRPGTAPGGNWDGSADTIIKTFRSGNYEGAVALLDQRRSKQAEPRGLSVVRGWAMFHKGDWEGARQVFSKLDNGQYSDERDKAMRVIEMGYTNPRFR